MLGDNSQSQDPPPDAGQDSPAAPKINYDIVDSDGNVDWSEVAGDAGSVGAVAICTAYGAGGAAPVCSFIGGKIGKALYSVASKVYDAIFGDDPPPPTPLPVPDTDINATIAALVKDRPDVLRQLLVVRGTSYAIRKTIVTMVRYWMAQTGQLVKPADMLALLRAGGLITPPAWASWFDGTLLGYNDPATSPFHSLAVEMNASVLVASAFGLPYCWNDGTQPVVPWWHEAGLSPDADGFRLGAKPVLGNKPCYETPRAGWDGLDPKEWATDAAIDCFVVQTSNSDGYNTYGPAFYLPPDRLALHPSAQVSLEYSEWAVHPGKPPYGCALLSAGDPAAQAAQAGGYVAIARTYVDSETMALILANYSIFTPSFATVAATWIPSLETAVAYVQDQVARVKTGQGLTAEAAAALGVDLPKGDAPLAGISTGRKVAYGLGALALALGAYAGVQTVRKKPIVPAPVKRAGQKVKRQAKKIIATVKRHG